MIDGPEATTWRIPRESKEWVGPITLDVTLDGIPAPSPAAVRFAVLPRDQRPADTDWTGAALDPAGTGGLGVYELPRPDYARLGIWARVSGVDEDVVLEPSDVGWIIRT